MRHALIVLLALVATAEPSQSQSVGWKSKDMPAFEGMNRTGKFYFPKAGKPIGDIWDTDWGPAPPSVQRQIERQKIWERKFREAHKCIQAICIGPGMREPSEKEIEKSEKRVKEIENKTAKKDSPAEKVLKAKQEEERQRHEACLSDSLFCS